MLDEWIERYRRFRAQEVAKRPDFFATLASEGQSPKLMVIGCSDSRTDPAKILQADFGQLFVIRNVANLVPPWSPDGNYHGTSAALEFGVKGLGVEHVVVLGHAGCGGAQALFQGADQDPVGTEFIGPWMSIGAAARERLRAEAAAAGREPTVTELEQALVGLSLENLMSFPWIAERVMQGVLMLHGWYFDIGTGVLFARDAESGVFTPL